MTALGLLGGLAAAVAVLLAVPGPRRAATAVVPPGPVAGPGNAGDAGDADGGLLRRWRAVWAGCAGAGVATVIGGPLGAPLGVGVAAATWVVAGRLEPPALRHRREEVRRDLPHVVGLFAAALRSGAAPAPAIGLVCRALPGAAADRLAGAAARLELGADPLVLWAEVAADAELGPLGRTMARAHRTGAPVVGVVERLGAELAERARGEVEDRARAVGVRAAVPLGVCLLPAFLLLGIVPLVAGLAREIAW